MNITNVCSGTLNQKSSKTFLPLTQHNKRKRFSHSPIHYSALLLLMLLSTQFFFFFFISPFFAGIVVVHCYCFVALFVVHFWCERFATTCSDVKCCVRLRFIRLIPPYFFFTVSYPSPISNSFRQNQLIAYHFYVHINWKLKFVCLCCQRFKEEMLNRMSDSRMFIASDDCFVSF